jgi:general secretion pathway protein D
LTWIISKNWLVPLLAAFLLAGCAAERSFREGKTMLSEGKVEEGLSLLEKAVKEDPEALEYRTYLLKQREFFAKQILVQADANLINNRFDEADAAYRRVLGLDRASPRANAGVEAVQAARRHKSLVGEAERAFNKGQIELAQDTLRQVLVDNPRHHEGKALQRRIEDKMAQSQVGNVQLISSVKKPITLEFRDASLQSVFEVISRTVGINFIFDKDVKSDLKTSLFVKNILIEDAIQLLLVSNQLEKKILNENTVLIYPNNPAKQRDYRDLVMRSFYLANADVKQTLNMIRTLLKTRDIFIDEKLNLLIMRDTPEGIRLAEKLIAAQDMAEPEVTLEVEILEVKRSRLTELGINYPNQFTVLSPTSTVTALTSGIGGIISNTSTVSGQLTVEGLKNLNGSRIGISNPVLNLRAEDSDTNMLANPRIRVKNRDKAKIHIGDKVPVITSTSTSTGFVAESVNYLDVGLKLDVEPSIHLDDEVDMKVGLEVSNIVREIKSANGTLTYQVGTRNASTTLRLRDGETQALAGLINDEDRKSANKVPGLGDIPVLGHLFSSHRDDRSKTEIVLLITPHIVRNLSRPEAIVAEFMSGTDAAIGSPQMGLRTAAPPPPEPPTVPPAPLAAPQFVPQLSPAVRVPLPAAQ